MEPAACHRGAAAQDEKKHARSVSLPNGALRKHHHHHHHRAAEPPAVAAEGVYRECMKNHAASLGGHALDGCGEFMPSPTADPAIPSSLVCAACGCHRNFHRRLLPRADAGNEEEHDNDNDEEEEDELEDEEEEGLRRSPAYSSAPHTLLALSHGLPGSMLPTGGGPLPASASASVLPRKRFRTKFTAEQKGRMQELSERLGWRMQKRDDGVVEERCREIGVSKGVFKVWMHNNKHTFLGTASSRRKEMLAGGGGGGGGAKGGGGGAAAVAANENNGGIAAANEGSKESSYVVNGSSSSS